MSASGSPLGKTSMAEYNQVAVLSAVLLFTALTARDIYLGRSSPQRGQATTPNLHRDAVPGVGSAKASLDGGPVLKFQFW